LRAVLRDPALDAELVGWLAGPPQTNEVARSCVLMAGLLTIAEATGLPLRLFELGTSAGLNLNLDRFGYRLGEAVTGDAASAVQLAPAWSGPAPPVADVTVLTRRGVDINPLDVSDAAVCERLMAYVWPGFILAPALGLLLLYLFSNEHSPGLLVPIGILLTTGATCFLSSVLGLWHILWPGFIMSPAVGLFLLYLFGERHNRGLLIPVGILGGISVFSFLGTFMAGSYGYGKYVLAVLLIIAGLLSIMKKPGEAGTHGKRWFAGHHEGPGQGWNTRNPADPSQGEDEAKNRESRREYGQQVYREYDAKFNQNPQYPGSDNNGGKPGGQSPDVNPYANSDYSRYNQEPPKK
jgi:hypothetical protein